MKLTIESTPHLTVLDGARVRVWKGRTERGIPCVLFVSRVAVDEGQDEQAFAAELEETLPPTVEVDLTTALDLDLGAGEGHHRG